MFFTLPVTTAAFDDRIQQSITLRFRRFFKQHAAADHHVAALAIQFQDANFNLAILPRFEIVHRPQFELRRGQKRPHANINDQSALDPFEHFRR